MWWVPHQLFHRNPHATHSRKPLEEGKSADILAEASWALRRCERTIEFAKRKQNIASPPNSTDTPSSGSSVWSMRDGNPPRTRCAGDLDLGAPPRLLWKLRFLEQERPPHRITAVVVDRETLSLICRIDQGWALEGTGQLERMYAVGVRLGDGDELWRYKGPDLRGNPEYAATLHEGKLFLVTEEGLVVLDSRTGELLKHLKKDWRDDSRYPSCAIVNAPNGRFYVSGRDGKVNCLDLADGRELWSTRVFSDWTYVHHLAMHRGKIVAVGVGGERGIAGLSAGDGEVLWCTSPAPRMGLFGKTVPGHLSITAEKALVVGSVRRFVIFPRFYLMGMEMGTGEMVWKTRNVYASPPTDGVRAYVPDMKRLSSLDLSSGLRSWETRKLYPVGEPVVSGGTVLLPCKDTLLRGISADNGETLWTVELDQNISRLAVTDEYIVAVLEDHCTVCVFTPSEGGSEDGE